MERRSIVRVGVTILVLVGALIGWVLLSPEPRGGPAELTETTDLAEIQKSVELGRLSIATSENYVGHKIRLILGEVKNISAGRPIRMVELKLVFSDFDGNPVQEDIAKAFKAALPPLLPGTAYRFRLAFENLPLSWNFRIPRAKVVRIGY